MPVISEPRFPVSVSPICLRENPQQLSLLCENNSSGCFEVVFGWVVVVFGCTCDLVLSNVTLTLNAITSSISSTECKCRLFSIGYQSHQTAHAPSRGCSIQICNFIHVSAGTKNLVTRIACLYPCIYSSREAFR